MTAEQPADQSGRNHHRKVKMSTTERGILEAKVLPELQAIASSMGVQGYQRLRKADLIGAIIAKAQGVEFIPSSAPSGRGRRGSSAGSATTGADAAASGAASAPEQQALPGSDGSGVSTPNGEERPSRRRRASVGAAKAVAAAVAAADGLVSDGPGALASEGNADAVPAAGNGNAGDGSERRPARAEQAAGEAGESQPAGQAAQVATETSGQGEQGGGQATTPEGQAGQGSDTRGDGQGGQIGQLTNLPAEGQQQGQTTQTQSPPQGDQGGDRGQRRDWNGQQGGGRWDNQPGQSSQGGGRRRNRNRRRNRYGSDQGGGGVGVMERPDQRERGAAADDRPEVTRTGTLDIRSQDGYGFLRVNGYLPGSDDVYVPLSMIRRMGLRRGDEIEGAVKLPRDSEKYAALVRVDKVNDMDPEAARQRKDFKDLTPLYPQDRLRLEHTPTEISTRIMDIMSPIGKGQRGMIVSPPKAGKTTLMKQIANAISSNNPEVILIILLIDERPEEVTDMQRSTKGQVIYSTFDRPSDDHCQVSELTIERAKRLVEYGKDVVILLDGITRLARAYNLATPASGKILSGGVDSSALYPPKRFLGAARNIEHGGSLTILATALVDTGSRMDEVIFEEFKATGNMEVRLDRKLSERRIFPALDVDASSTRKEELLLSEEELVVAWKLRRVLGALEPAQALELVVDKMRATKTNAEFLRQIQRANIG
jgi:transcription termination factor Rho